MNPGGTNKIIPLFALIITISTSCKKDKLHFNKVEILQSQTNDRLNSILLSGNNIYIAGGDRFTKSTIVISRNNGETWQVLDFPESGKALYGIAQNQSGNIYAVGYDAKMLWTTDNGYHWSFRQMANWQPFKDISFAESNKAIGIMGISYNKGGIAEIDSFGDISRYDSTAIEYNDIEMITAQTGYICGYGIMMKTTDGAKTWNIQNVKNDNFTALCAINVDDIWMCGINGSIFHTTNGGTDWIRKRNGNDLLKPKYNLHDLLFIDDTNGWAVGENGMVINTTDGGDHWSEYEKFTSNTLRSIAMMPDGNLIVCGDNGGVYKLIR